MIWLMTSAWFVWPSLFALAMTWIWVKAVLHYNPAPAPGQFIAMNPAVFEGVVPVAGSVIATIGAITPIIMVDKVRDDPISLALLSVITLLLLTNTVLGHWLRESIRTLPRDHNKKVLVDSRLHITVRAAMIGIFCSIVALVVVFLLFSPLIGGDFEPPTPPLPDNAHETTVAPEPGIAGSGTGQDEAPTTEAAPPPDGASHGNSETTVPKN